MVEGQLVLAASPQGHMYVMRFAVVKDVETLTSCLKLRSDLRGSWDKSSTLLGQQYV